jgi:hypothetical protein
MASLSAAELLKPGREYRVDVIIRKLAEGSPFELVIGSKQKFVNSREVVALLNKRTSIAFNTVRFTDFNGKIYKLTDLKKTSEFGGKGEGSGTAKEDMQLKLLKEQIAFAKRQEARSTIKVRVNNTTYDVADAVTTPGTPKSDFHLVDLNGKEVVWISHKDGSRPNDFQQWGGISQSKEPTIANHPETKKFVEDLKRKYPGGLPPATSLYRTIQDKRLKMLSVYGNQFGGMLGQQNVSILLQGPVKLVKQGQYYKLTSNHVHYNGDSVDAGGFEPVLMAIYKGDRSDAGVKGTRIVIMPIAGRKARPLDE